MVHSPKNTGSYLRPNNSCLTTNLVGTEVVVLIIVDGPALDNAVAVVASKGIDAILQLIPAHTNRCDQSQQQTRLIFLLGGRRSIDST